MAGEGLGQIHKQSAVACDLWVRFDRMLVVSLNFQPPLATPDRASQPVSVLVVFSGVLNKKCRIYP